MDDEMRPHDMNDDGSLDCAALGGEKTSVDVSETIFAGQNKEQLVSSLVLLLVPLW